MEIEIPFGAFDSELMRQEINIPEGFEATIEGNKIILTKTESEDELTWLTKYIEEEVYSLSMDIRDNEDRVKLKKLQRSLAWLEKQEWSEEEQVSEEFINALGTMLNDGLPDRYLVSEERIKKSAELLFSIARKQLKNEMQEWSEEVDLEKETDKYISENFYGSETLGFFANRTKEEPNWKDIALCAKHFFELGLKTRKGE